MSVILGDVDEYHQVRRMRKNRGAAIDGAYCIDMYDCICRKVLNRNGLTITTEYGEDRPLTVHEMATDYFTGVYDDVEVEVALACLTAHNLLVKIDEGNLAGAYAVNGLFHLYTPFHNDGIEIKNWQALINAGNTTDSSKYLEKRRQIAKKVADEHIMSICMEANIVPLSVIKESVKAKSSAHVNYWVKKLNFADKQVMINNQRKGLPKEYADVVIAAMKGITQESYGYQRKIEHIKIKITVTTF